MNSNVKCQLSNVHRGFTLIEILITLGLLAVVFSFGLFISFDFYKSYSSRSEQDVVVSILQKARSQAMDNINQTKHGVHYGSGVDCHSFSKCYVLFEENSFVSGTSSNLEIESNPATTVTWSADPVFNQLDGSVNPVTITLQQGSKTWIITTNSQGRIDWQ